MARLPNSDAGLRALGEFRGTIERGGNPRALAFNHNLGRNIMAVKLLTIIRLMRQAGKPLTGTVTCVKAERQDFSSPADMTMLGHVMGSMQAAHFMPGTIRVNGTPIWRFATDPGTIGHIEALFAAVEHLPTVYNQADTAAEAKGTGAGLCAALAAACQTLISGGAAGAGGSLQAAYQVWFNGALIGLRGAMINKSSLGVLPDLVKDADGNIDLSAREAAADATRNRDDAVRILGYYLEDQEHRDWAWVQARCQTVMNDAAAEFRS